MKAHARTETWHIDNSQIAIHQEIWLSRFRLNSKSRRLHKSDLSLIAPPKTIFSEVHQSFFIFYLKGPGGGRTIAEEVRIGLIGPDTV